jgi:hypothetical protein
LTSIELYSNQEFYAFHPYVKDKTRFFKSENTTFSASASDAALGDGYDRKNPNSRVAVVRREAVRNATIGTFASLMCVFALSSVTGMNIISVYPEELDHETKYSQFQNGTIFPRRCHKNFSGKLAQNVKLILMWTTNGIVTLPGLSEDFQPNHFVPLLEFNININKKIGSSQQKKITDHFPSHCGKKEDNIDLEGMVIRIYVHIVLVYILVECYNSNNTHSKTYFCSFTYSYNYMCDNRVCSAYVCKFLDQIEHKGVQYSSICRF